MVNFKASIQAVDYIIKEVSDNGILDKLTILKLLFFAERYSMRKYAQSITNDKFVAMRCGPVASLTLDLIGFKDLPKDKLDYTNEILEKIPPYFVKSKGVLISRDDYDELSDTDIEALCFSTQNYGQYSSKKLVEITHKFKEWNRFESKLKKQDTKFDILIDDFFAKTTEQTNEYSIIPDEVVELNKEFFKEAEFDR